MTGILHALVEDAAREAGVPAAAIVGEGKSREIVAARWRAMARGYELGFSAAQIGKVFRKDHTSVRYAVRTMERRVNGLPYYKRYPRDFIEGTVGMPFELKCAYGLVLDLIYMHGGRLPDDRHYIAGVLGCSSKQWTWFRKGLIERGKISVSGAFLLNNRATIECVSTENARRTQKENVAKRWAKRSDNNDLPDTAVIPTDIPNSYLPDTDTDIGGGGGRAREADDHVEILLAAGVDPAKDVTGKWHSSTAQHTVGQWRGLGLSQAEILTEIAGVMRGRTGPPGSLAYFTDAMRRAAGQKAAPALTPINGGRPTSPDPPRLSKERMLEIMREATAE